MTLILLPFLTQNKVMICMNYITDSLYVIFSGKSVTLSQYHVKGVECNDQKANCHVDHFQRFLCTQIITDDDDE